jgi:hypothetical protein
MSHKIHIDLNTTEEVLRIKNTKLLQVFIYCKKVSNIAKLNLIFLCKTTFKCEKKISIALEKYFVFRAQSSDEQAWRSHSAKSKRSSVAHHWFRE